MSICNCTTKAKNFGVPNCPGILARPGKLAFVHTKADDGTVNKVLSTDVINDAFVTGKINHVDTSKRWFPTGEINKVNDTRADVNTFEIDGFNITSSEGVRTMAFTVVDGASPELAASYNSIACKEMSFFVFSIANQLGGNGRIVDELRPFRIKRKTLTAVYQPENKENETPAMIMVKFDLSELESDEHISFISPGTGATEVQIDLLSYSGLLDVELGVATGISTIGFTMIMTLIFGSHFKHDAFEGGVITDFISSVTGLTGKVRNLTTGLDVTLTTVTETNADGVSSYAFVTPAIVVGNVIRVKFRKDGFEGVNTIDYIVV